ncbi:MAG TPA: hypothetical protein VFX16_08880 [Pseudonocardiaceae bacterium]|nr:hypothetical protein [Pseudonocardiaceae bacterium]
MTGPYPPPGYPPQPGQPGQPGPSGQDGWWGGQPEQSGPQPSSYDFPTVRYSGLGNRSGGGWGEPPRPPRSTGRLVVAVVSVLVIVGGVVTGIFLLKHQHQQAAAPPPNVAAPLTTAATTTEAPTQEPTEESDDPGVPNGSTELTLPTGACVRARVSGAEKYTVVQQVTCGSAESDLVLAEAIPDLNGCEDHQYLRLTAPNAGVYCFTLDIKKGDCVDENYLKTSCGTAAFTVLKTESGPGSGDSCTTATGATHWVPIGRDPVEVGCLGPTHS